MEKTVSKLINPNILSNRDLKTDYNQLSTDRFGHKIGQLSDLWKPHFLMSSLMPICFTQSLENYSTFLMLWNQNKHNITKLEFKEFIFATTEPNSIFHLILDILKNQKNIIKEIDLEGSIIINSCWKELFNVLLQCKNVVYLGVTVRYLEKKAFIYLKDFLENIECPIKHLDVGTLNSEHTYQNLLSEALSKNVSVIKNELSTNGFPFEINCILNQNLQLPLSKIKKEAFLWKHALRENEPFQFFGDDSFISISEHFFLHFILRHFFSKDIISHFILEGYIWFCDYEEIFFKSCLKKNRIRDK